MKTTPVKYVKFLTFFLILTTISCAQKNEVDPPVVENVPQVVKTSTQDETVTEKAPEQEKPVNVIAQITAKPEQKDPAKTSPKISKIKKYKSTKKENFWFLIGGVSGQRSYSVFVDPETIESSNGLVESWSKLEFEESQVDQDGLSYKTVQIESSIDCEARTYSYTDSKFYDGLDRLVESQRAPYEPSPIVDGTVSAQIADFVCGYELNKPDK